LLASLIRDSEDGAEDVTDRVLTDGTCVINTAQYAVGTTIEISQSTGDGTVVYVVRDISRNVVETFYTVNGDVLVTVVYYIVKGDVAAGIPDRVAPGILVSRQFHFDTGRWNILPNDKPIEKTVALAIEEVAQVQGPLLHTIEVQGHTDDVGGGAANLVLSQKRAEEVRAVLLQKLNQSSMTPPLPWEQFLIAKGYGSGQPISGPSGKDRYGNPVFTRKDRTLNRRVEIHFNY
jgi:outer membrane protein OmpA-like peptidoglycan-associated protein